MRQKQTNKRERKDDRNERKENGIKELETKKETTKQERNERSIKKGMRMKERMGLNQRNESERKE